MSQYLAALKERLGQLSDIEQAAALAHWDQQTMMPVHGAAARAQLMSTLARTSHETFVAEETGRLLEGAAGELDAGEAPDPDSDDARLVWLTDRQWEKARRVPTELAAQRALASSAGHETWVAARARSDFAAFEPALARNVELARRYAECHAADPAFSTAYDALLDDFEPRMPTTAVARLFDELKAELVPMIAQIAACPPIDDEPLYARFPVDGQRRLVDEVVALMGFTDEEWRIDDAVHPFAMLLGTGDVRITTRWDESFWPTGLYGAMHECGHGLYEAGIAASLMRTPLGSAESLGVHESQSRMWENMVGRGRPFCGVLAPRIAELAGGQLAGIDPDRLYAAVNRVKPTLIRVEADEATYALHIILRFELEQQLIDGTLKAADLPEAWNARFQEYFGITVADDAAGVLQDVHWSAGMFGYFPAYALGNLIAGQLWERAHVDLPTLEGQLATGELSPLREWLREHVHRYGAKFTTTELLERETGAPISVAPFVRYLKAKLSEVYGLDLIAASDHLRLVNNNGVITD
jgi:carboxypeptidase Taq